MPRDIVSLRQERAKAYEKMEAALAIEGDDRQTQFDTAAAEVETLDTEIANAERLQKLRGKSATGTPESEGLDPDQAMGFMSKYRNLPASAHVVPQGSALSAAQTAALADTLAAVKRAKVTGQIDPMLIGASQGANEAIMEDGGALLEKDVADGLLRRAFEVSRIASKAKRIPLSARSNGIKINAMKDDSRATGSRWGGVQMYWIGEGDSLTPSRPKFRQMNLQLKKVGGLMYATSEALQDLTALAGIINQAYPDELAFVLDDTMFEGDGTATPLGFMNSGCKVT
ncbi:MAG: phage major capsid protein, partial [Actinomycetota bacterium]